MLWTPRLRTTAGSHTESARIGIEPTCGVSGCSTPLPFRSHLYQKRDTAIRCSAYLRAAYDEGAAVQILKVHATGQPAMHPSSTNIASTTADVPIRRFRHVSTLWGASGDFRSCSRPWPHISHGSNRRCWASAERQLVRALGPRNSWIFFLSDSSTKVVATPGVVARKEGCEELALQAGSKFAGPPAAPVVNFSQSGSRHYSLKLLKPNFTAQQLASGVKSVQPEQYSWIGPSCQSLLSVGLLGGGEDGEEEARSAL